MLQRPTPKSLSWRFRVRIGYKFGVTFSTTTHDNFSALEPSLNRTLNENSMLTLDVPKKRESESSRSIFRTDGRNLEGCVRETEISLQTEIAAVWAGETRKA